VKLAVDRLVDCGATSDFIDSEYITANDVPVRWFFQPIPVYNVDSSPNEAESIQEVTDVVLHYWTHSEHVVLAVTQLGKQKLILGYSWVLLALEAQPGDQLGNREIKMSWCPSVCTTCCDKVRTEHQHAKIAAALLRQL
jgi:hypothetical protein